jgi:hypothetical protein
MTTATLTATPTPLKTILTPERYPFAVAIVENGKITGTVSYASTLEDVYNQCQGWRASIANYSFPHDYIMVEQKDLDNTPNYSYWVAV